MSAVALSLGVYAAFWLVGAATLSVRSAAQWSAREHLCAPILGACVATLATLVLSALGLTVDGVAGPLAFVLLVASAALLVRRRPRVPITAVLTGLAALVVLPLASTPMFDLGFDWMANGNSDMSAYALSAQRLLHHGYNAPLDIQGLLATTDLAEAFRGLQVLGVRLGADLLMALTSAVSGETPLEVSMPVITAIQMSAACAVGALAFQAVESRLAAVLAALLYALSPMATYGLEQQLMPQTYGLGIAAALVALVMHPGTYRDRRSVVVVAILFAGFCVAYIDLLPLLGAAYGLYAVIALRRGSLTFSGLRRLWLPAGALAALLLIPYWRGLDYLKGVLVGRLNAGEASDSVFSYMLTPNALPGSVGVQTLIPPYNGDDVAVWIVIGGVLLVGLIALGLYTTYREEAAGVVLTTILVLGLTLALRGDDFGLFKLTMVAAPFVAAALAVLASRRPWALLPLLALLPFWWSTQREYVAQARHPADVPEASSHELLPELRELLDGRSGPLVSGSDNLVVNNWIAGEARGVPTTILGRDQLNVVLAHAASKGMLREHPELDPWIDEKWTLGTSSPPKTIEFRQNTTALEYLRNPACRLLLPGASASVVNRGRPWNRSDPLQALPCTSTTGALAFIWSPQGRHYYLPEGGSTTDIAFWQMEGDPSGLSPSFMAVGRYALFQVINPPRGMRMVVDMTVSYQPSRTATIPPVSVAGASAHPLDAVGFGSARIASEPMTPMRVGDASYVAVDMGREPEELGMPRSGLSAAWGGSVRFDRRYAVARLRGLWVMGEDEYRLKQAPTVARLPDDLAKGDLEYSGIAEDGWVGQDSWVRVRSTPGATLRVAGEIPGEPGSTCEVTVSFDGQRVTRTVRPGSFDLRGPTVIGPERSRKARLHFGCAQPLPAPDLRLASALLRSVAFVPR